MAENVFDISIGTAVDKAGLKKGLKESEKAVKDFAKSAGQELLGIDQVLSTVAGGPAAMGKAFVDMGKQAVAALNEMAAMYREQEQAETALQNAAKNNPYLNDRSVKQLKSFADEMQRITGIDSVQVLQTETRLASLGRTQEQIQQIIKVSMDAAAAGTMDFDTAVMELNRNFNGVVGRMSGQLVPALKNLTAEELAAGKGIEMLAEKVKGAAEESMKSGAGGVTRFQNAVADLKKIAGEGWESFLKGPREAAAEVTEKIVDTIKHARELKRAQEELGKLSKEQQEEEIRLLEEKEELQKNTAVLGARTQAQLQQKITEIDKQIKALHEQAKLNNIISEAGLLITEDELNEKLKMQAYLLRERNKLMPGSKDYKTVDESLQVATALAEKYQFQVKVIKEQLELREKDKTAAEKQAALDKARADKEKEDEDKRVKFREKYEEALKKTLDGIKLEAGLRGEFEEKDGERVYSLAVQNQLINAQISAYKGLIDASNGLLDGTLSYEQAEEAAMRSALAAYNKRAETEKRADEERKNRLANLAKQQEEAEETLRKIFEDAYGEGRRLDDAKAEQDHQDKIAKIRKASAKKAAEAQAQYELNRLKSETGARMQAADEAYKKEINAFEELQMRVKNDAKLTEDEKTRILEQALAGKYKAEQEYDAAVKQLIENSAAEKKAIEQRETSAIKEMYREMFAESLKYAQEFLSAASSIASSISTAWKNNIDFELNEKLRANDEMEQSDEDRAAREKDLQKQAAKMRYDADMFAWRANVIMATAQAAMAVLNAWATGGAAAAALAVLAGIAGAVQVAAVASAQPQRPRFHTGGVVPGRAGQEVTAVLQGKEKVLTDEHFSNTMRAIANLADAKFGSAGTAIALNVHVDNRAPGTEASASIDKDGLRIVVTELVNESLANGGLEPGMAKRELRNRGLNFTV